MCQFKTAVTPAGAGSGSPCRCQAGAAAAEALRQMPPDLVEKLFAPLPSRSLPPQTPPVSEDVCASHKSSETELEEKRQTDANNNKIRSSRLKTAKSLPCEKRRVQFADELGQTLTDVRWFESEPLQLFKAEAPLELLLQIHFERPCAMRALKALEDDKCCVQLSGLKLDQVSVGASLTGYAMVKNLSFHKRVFVRITADSWRNFADLEADYAGSLDDKRDVFEFELRCEIEEVDFEFCIGFEAGDRERQWDSNGGRNYRVSLAKPKRATFSLWGNDED